MKKFFKAVGFLLLSILPFIAANILQYIIVFAAMLLKAISMFLANPSGFSMENYYTYVASSQFNSLVLFIYGLFAILLLGIWYRVAAVPKGFLRRGLRQVINGKILLAMVLLTASFQYITTYLIILIQALRPSWDQSYELLMDSAGINDITLILALYSVVVAPICEELIFRGVCLYYAKKALPFWIANLFQAAFFGVYHMNLVQGIYAFLLGLLLGYVCDRGRSIYLSILLHFLFNFWGTFLFSSYFYSGDNILLSTLQFLLIWTAAAAGIILYKSGVKGRRLQPPA